MTVTRTGPRLAHSLASARLGRISGGNDVSKRRRLTRPALDFQLAAAWHPNQRIPARPYQPAFTNDANNNHAAEWVTTLLRAAICALWTWPSITPVEQTPTIQNASAHAAFSCVLSG